MQVNIYHLNLILEIHLYSAYMEHYNELFTLNQESTSTFTTVGLTLSCYKEL
jgi:Trk-type K+ transport system membrane component